MYKGQAVIICGSRTWTDEDIIRVCEAEGCSGSKMETAVNLTIPQSEW